MIGCLNIIVLMNFVSFYTINAVDRYMYSEVIQDFVVTHMYNREIFIIAFLGARIHAILSQIEV